MITVIMFGCLLIGALIIALINLIIGIAIYTMLLIWGIGGIILVILFSLIRTSDKKKYIKILKNKNKK